MSVWRGRWQVPRPRPFAVDVPDHAMLPASDVFVTGLCYSRRPAGAAALGRHARLSQRAPQHEPLEPFPNSDPAAYYTPEWWARQQQPPPPPRWWEWRRWLPPWLAGEASAADLLQPPGPERTVRVAPVRPGSGGVASPAELRLPEGALTAELGAGGLAPAANPEDSADSSYFRCELLPRP